MDLEKIKEQLQKKKAEILQNLENHKSEDINEKSGVEDAADIVASELNRETLYKLTQADRETLFLIDLALQKIESGTYGYCELCGEPIGEKRLKAIPWVRLCIKCSENEEAIKSIVNKNEEFPYYSHIIPDQPLTEDEDNKQING